MENRCVCCGAVIPEGRQVCPACEECTHVWLFDKLVTGTGGARYISYKCQRCGVCRIGDVIQRAASALHERG